MVEVSRIVMIWNGKKWIYVGHIIDGSVYIRESDEVLARRAKSLKEVEDIFKSGKVFVAVYRDYDTYDGDLFEEDKWVITKDSREWKKALDWLFDL